MSGIANSPHQRRISRHRALQAQHHLRSDRRQETEASEQGRSEYERFSGWELRIAESAGVNAAWLWSGARDREPSDSQPHEDA